MPTYRYSARDKQGNPTSGTQVAESEVDLRQTLRVRDLYITNYELLSDQAFHVESKGLFKSRKIKLYDMVVMSRQLASLVRAGITIVECLESVARQTENPTLAEALFATRQDVLAGDSLSEAMRKRPKVFTEVYSALVEAGETGGMLEQTLEVAAEQFDRQAKLREQVHAAMVYPIIVIVASVLVVAFMLIFIVPIFAKVYKQFNADLPAITLFLIWLSNVILRWWWIVLGVLVGIYFAIKYYYTTDHGRHTIDALKLKFPLVGKLLRKIAIAQFTQTWAGTTKGGIPIINSLQVAGNTSSNILIRDAAFKMAESVKIGSPITSAMEETGEFPPMVTRMVASGERSGNLDEMLSELTKFYERDIDFSVQRLTRVMEPVLTVIVGSIVLFVLLALYMPVFNLSQVIRKR